MGRIEHDNPADYYNTVLKMAKKRAHVDAVLTATAASDIFTQDIEDMPEVIDVTPKPAKPANPKKPKQTGQEPDKNDYERSTPKQRQNGIYKYVGAKTLDPKDFILWCAKKFNLPYDSLELFKKLIVRKTLDGETQSYIDAKTNETNMETKANQAPDENDAEGVGSAGSEGFNRPA